MLNKNIIFAVAIYYLYYWKHSLDRIGDSFYWPAVNILLWGLMSAYVKTASTNIPEIAFVLLTGVVFWLVIWRAQHEISVNLLEEFWNRNLVNLFSTPLRMREWILGVLILSTIKMCITLVFASLLAYLLYSFNVFMYGILLIPFTASLLLTGWVLGFLVSAIVIRLGPTFQTLAWTGPMLITPFSALYYPVSILPDWAQTVARFVPSSYILEGMREILFTGNLSYDKLITSFALNTIYLVLSISLFVYMFNESRKLGLSRLIT